MMNNSKKRSFIVTIITFILIIGGIALQPIHAEDDGPEYTISKLNINCQIEKNGAVRLTRTVTYHFNDYADGLTYQQELPKTNSSYHVEKVEVADNNAKLKPIQQNDSENNNTYTVTQGDKDDTFLIKTYHSVKCDNNVTIRYVFTMDDAITNYADAARLNYKVIGNNTDVTQKNIHIKFNFGQKSLTPFKAWMHCNASHTQNISAKDGTLSLAIKKLPANTYVETDILFPKSVTAQNPNVKNLKIISKTIAQEKKITHERELLFFLNYCLLPLIIIGYAVLRFLIVRRKAQKARILKVGEIPHNFDIPTMPVGMANALLKERGSVFTGETVDKFNTFIGELLQLHNEGKIKIESTVNNYEVLLKKSGPQIKDDSDYQITLKDSSIINGKFSKKEDIYSLLFYVIGDGHKFTLNQLRKIASGNRQRAKEFLTALDNWFNEYLSTVEKQYTISFADKISKNNRKYLIATLIILSVWVIIEVSIFDSGKIIAIALLCLAISLLSVFTYHRNTNFNTEGLEKHIKISGFKKMLHDTSNFKNSKLDDLTLWKDILPYAAGFGLAPKILDRLHQSFSEAEFISSFHGNDFYYEKTDGKYFYVKVRITFSDVKSSASGGDSSSSSSGFGSSGGFGGNSGDGAF